MVPKSDMIPLEKQCPEGKGLGGAPVNAFAFEDGIESCLNNLLQLFVYVE